MTDPPVVGAIDWGSHDGGLVERALSVLLLREKPGWRREASSGDRGVDIAYPHSGGYQVDQVKGFTGQLTANRKGQIERSLAKVIDDPELPGPVTLWRLVVPMDPSKEAEKWFGGLVAAAPFPCEWRGRTYVDDLATHDAPVVDYYFRDGKGALEQRLRDLRNAVEVMGPNPAPLRPGELPEGLLRLYEAINREDPHFRYEFEVSATSTSLADAQRPGCVMAHAVGTADGTFVITRVFARYPQATEDRPIPLTFSATFGPDDDGPREGLRRAFAYGADATLPDGTVGSLTIGAPGGLDSTTSEGVTIHILGHEDDDFVPFRMRMQVTDQAGLILGETMVDAQHRRRGTHGAVVHFSEAQGAFTFTLTTGLDRNGAPFGEFSDFDIDPLTSPATRIHGSMKLLAELRRPNILRLLPEHGSTDDGAWWQVNNADAPIHGDLLRLIDALAALQVLTSRSLHVPDELTQSDVSSIVEAGRLVRGEEITKTWSKVEVPVRVAELDETIAVFSGPGLGLEGDFRLTIGEVEVGLGRFHKRYRSIAPLDQGEVRRRASALDPDEMVTVELRPGDDDRVDFLPRPLFAEEGSARVAPSRRPAEDEHQ